MHFDPIHNYDDTDLTNKNNLVRWKFGELIKNLVTLSSSAEKQKKIIGVGATCDEMAIDFETYFTHEFQRYLDCGLLTSSQVEKLKDLDRYFDERSGDKSPDFWDDFLLETNSEWQNVRQQAKTILAALNMPDLTIEFDRTEKYEMTNNGEQLTMQTTKTRLVKQTSN